MPPKKKAENIASSAKASKERAPRKKGVKEKVEKPKLKTPTVVKMKLPSVKSFLQNTAPTKCKNKGNDPPDISPGLQRKMDLANEVAMAQLVKPNNLTVTKFVAGNTDKKRIVKRQTKPQTETPKPRGRRSKKKAAVADQPVPYLVAEESASEQEVVPKKKRAYVRKKPPPKKAADPEPKVFNANQKALADSTSTEVKVKRKYNRKTKVIQCQNSEQNVENIVLKVEVASIPEKKPGRKGKRKVLTEDLNQSPSLLQEASKIIENRLLEPVTTQSNESQSQTISAPIDSRKTSTSECLSWTKDISSSSTTTCMTVGSNELTKIGKKLPVLRLSNIGNEWKKITENKVPDESPFEAEHYAAKPTSSSSSESSDSSSSSSSSSSSEDESSRRSEKASLNLSASSVSPSKSFATHTSLTVDEDWECALNKVSANLRRLDLEALNWEITMDKNMNIDHEKILTLLQFEKQVLQDCSDIKNLLRPDKSTSENKENHQDGNFLLAQVDPNLDTDRSEDDNFKSTQSKYVMLNQNSTPEKNALLVCSNEKNNSDEEKVAEDKLLYDPTDDDDALSIYAESLTGLESTRYESSANSICANASDHEEYVPPMISQEKQAPFSYIPTKINEETSTDQNYRNKTICEKQNADSTSLFARDNEHYKNERQSIAFGSKPAPCASQTVIRPHPSNPPPPRLIVKPLLMHHVHTITLNCTKSIIFRGVCFFNLISNCRKIQCRYPHAEMDKVEVRNRLSKLTEESFIKEYILLRRWPTLRRLYGMLYVSECIERNLIRILVEMAIDFIAKAKTDSVEDSNLKTNVCERVLLYLNDKDLRLCEDLLHYNFGSENYLCLAFLRIIGESQNFSRFKSIFVKLTNFIKELGLTFNLDVANLILERVCILPFDEWVARSMCTIILNSDIRIFEHPMISRFENHVSMLVDQVTYEQYYVAKDDAMLKLKQAQVANENVSPPKINQEIDMNPMPESREERYTSPDTTKLDNTNKAIEEKSTPQTVQMIRPPTFGRPTAFQTNTNDSQTFGGPTSYHTNADGPQTFGRYTNMNGPQRVDNESVASRPKFRSWWGNKFGGPHYNNAGNMGNNNRYNGYNNPREMRPPLLKRRPDQRLVAFGAPPPKFIRRHGPRF